MLIWLIFLLMVIYYVGRRTGYFRDLFYFADDEDKCREKIKKKENLKI